jgi:hypothetical protein
VKWMSLAILCTSLSGCAMNFGLDRTMTRVMVSSDAKARPYHLLRYDEASKLLFIKDAAWVPSDSTEWARLKDRAMPGLTTGLDVVNYVAGRHVAAVQCGNKERIETVTLQPDVVNRIEISCV